MNQTSWSGWWTKQAQVGSRLWYVDSSLLGPLWGGSQVRTPTSSSRPWGKHDRQQVHGLWTRSCFFLLPTISSSGFFHGCGGDPPNDWRPSISAVDQVGNPASLFWLSTAAASCQKMASNRSGQQQYFRQGWLTAESSRTGSLETRDDLCSPFRRVWKQQEIHF